MEKVTKRFVKFWRPGFMFAEDWSREVETLDPHAIEWPENAYAFTLHERTDVMDGDQTYVGKAEQIGPMYYHPDSKVETLDQAKSNPESTSTLIANMECNDWNAIVWSRWGNWPQPFDPSKACVLTAA